VGLFVSSAGVSSGSVEVVTEADLEVSTGVPGAVAQAVAPPPEA